MLVVLLSRRCFHCVQVDQFIGPDQVADYARTLIGTACSLCETVIEQGDIDLVMDAEAPQQVEEGRATWYPNLSRPANFWNFFGTAEQGPAGEIAAKLAHPVDAAAKERRRAKCKAGTAILVPLIASHAQEAMDTGRLDAARRAFAVCVEHGEGVNRGTSLFFLGQLDQGRGDLAAAARHYRQAAQSPEIELRASALLYHGLAVHEMGHRKDALHSYRECVDCGESAVRGMAAHRLGLLLEFFGDRSGAREAYRIAVRHRDDETSASAAANLALLDREQ